MRRLLARILAQDARFLPVGFARNRHEVRAKMEATLPDLLIVDPNMTAHDRAAIMMHVSEESPAVHVLLCVPLDERDARLTMEELRAGAQSKSRPEELHCPSPGDGPQFAAEMLRRLREACNLPAVRATPDVTSGSRELGPLGLRGAAVSRGSLAQAAWTPRFIPRALTIGCSTGGPAALTEILPLLPADFAAPVLIVQHMPPLFTRLFAERLARVAKIPVLEAENAMEVRPGIALIAPGDFHMRVVRKLDRVEVLLTREPHENSCRPAVDVLFRSMAEVYNGAVVATVLTGMGQDGLRGAKVLKEQGASIFVQDRATSVVWGMPGAIAEAGFADAVLPLAEIVPEVLKLL